MSKIFRSNRKRFLVSDERIESNVAPEEIHLSLGTIYMEGSYHIKLTNTKTGVVEKDHSFSNVITYAGLNALGEISGTTSWTLANLFNTGAKLQLGSGSTPPTPEDTKLEGYFAQAGERVIAQEAGNNADQTQYWYGYRFSYTFYENDGNGDISEFGLRPGNLGQFLWSRALYKDESGSASFFTKTNEQQLDITYKFRYYTPTGSWSGTVVISAASYSYTGSALNIDNGELWTYNSFFGTTGGFLNGFGRWSGAPLNLYPSASVLIHPTGSGRNFNQGVGTFYSVGANSTAYTYEVNSFLKKLKFTVNPAYANYGGIPGVGVYYCWVGNHNDIDGAGHTQILFNPPLPKTDVDRLIIVTHTNWSQSVEINE